jgi:hypothetical protein
MYQPFATTDLRERVSRAVRLSSDQMRESSFMIEKSLELIEDFQHRTKAIEAQRQARD